MCITDCKVVVQHYDNISLNLQSLRLIGKFALSSPFSALPIGNLSSAHVLFTVPLVLGMKKH